MFEGLLADNYLFLNLTECIEYIDFVIKPFIEKDSEIDSFICKKNIYEVYDRYSEKIIQKNSNDEEVFMKYLEYFTEEELSVIYYKNNAIEFIRDHEIIQDIILNIFESIENLDYIENREDWFSYIPDKYRKDFMAKSYKDWNNFVNKTYFLDPNSPPDNIKSLLDDFSDYMMKYVYSQYISVDKIYRLKNFKRRVVTVIDTDSNILSMDTLINFIFDEIIKNQTFGRSKTNNEFIAINLITYLVTNAVTDILLQYGKLSNIPEEYRPIFNMKNEFYFSKLVIGETKKRYISKILLREGNLMNPPKKNITGFDFKKSTCSEFAEDFYMSLINKYIIETDGEIDVRGILRELNMFKKEIHDSIERGERTYLPNAAAKEAGAYKNPESVNTVAGVMAWNYTNPNNRIDLPSKVSLVKLNIFELEDIADMKYTFPDIYSIIEDKVFNDKTGLFVNVKVDPGVSYVNTKDKEWYKKIPAKYRTKYKKLGPEEWNTFVDSYEGDTEDGSIVKSKGLQVLAIPSNGTIPDWAKPYIDYNVMIDNILAPFIPVLEIFKSKQLISGKVHKGVDRSSTTVTNIIKL